MRIRQYLSLLYQLKVLFYFSIDLVVNIVYRSDCKFYLCVLIMTSFTAEHSSSRDSMLIKQLCRAQMTADGKTRVKLTGNC